MDTMDVAKLNVIERFMYWIQERETIRLRKESGEERPWTDDSILDLFRFCNVRRMDDRVSQWLLTNWYEPYHGHSNMLYAASLARFINLPSSLKEITDDVFNSHGDPHWESIKDTLREIKDKDQKVFNGAYMVRGNDGEDKVSSVVDFYVGGLVKDSPQINSDSMRETWLYLTPSYGFGSFMAGQVVADLRWGLPGLWSDKNWWAPPGPGSMRGLNRLLDKSLKLQYREEEFCDYLIAIIDHVGPLLPREITDRMEAHDWQNCLCEFDKYERTLWGEGRPKSLYRPRIEEEELE